MSRCSTDYVARSYTPSLTVPSLWYHPHSIQPSYLRPSSLPYISIVILPTQCSSLLTICPYQFRILSWTSIAISPTFGVSILYLSFLILSTFVTYHISIVAISFIVPSAMSLPRSYHCHVQPSLGSSRSFSVSQHYTDSFQFFYLFCTLRDTSASSSPSSSNVDPR